MLHHVRRGLLQVLYLCVDDALKGGGAGAICDGACPEQPQASQPPAPMHATISAILLAIMALSF